MHLLRFKYGQLLLYQIVARTAMLDFYSSGNTIHNVVAVSMVMLGIHMIFTVKAFFHFPYGNPFVFARMHPAYHLPKMNSGSL
jgi:hypothetical protein